MKASYDEMLATPLAVINQDLEFIELEAAIIKASENAKA
jgi:hypothetical protein